jgi:hypothetical protein
LSIEKKLKAIRQRLLSNCLMKILFECRPRVDLHSLELAKSQARDVETSMLSTVLASLVHKLQRKQIAAAFDRIEAKSVKADAQLLAGRILEALFVNRRQAMQRVFLITLRQSRRADVDSVCRGAFALYKLFLDHTKLQKYQFFQAGKRIFELERLSVPMQRPVINGPEGRKLIKSNSLIMATTNNLRLGFYVLERKRVEQMKATFQ